jgi:hypothetical protein
MAAAHEVKRHVLRTFEDMSKQNNVNPNFYKVGGREPSEGHGESIPHEQEKQQMNAQGGRKRGNQPLPGNKEKPNKR